MNILFVLGTVLIILKLLSLITLSWFLVLSPFFIWVVLYVLLICLWAGVKR